MSSTNRDAPHCALLFITAHQVQLKLSPTPHAYQTTGTITALCIFRFQTGIQKILQQQALPEFNLLLISSCVQLCLVGVFPIYIFELMYRLPLCSTSVPADIQATHHINLYYTQSLCMYDPLIELSFRTTTFSNASHCVRWFEVFKPANHRNNSAVDTASVAVAAAFLIERG